MRKLLWIYTLVCLLVQPVAANHVPELNQSGSIQISMQYEGDPVSGGELTLYRVGDIREDDGNYSFILTDTFASCSVTLENVQSSETAERLSDYARRKGIKGQTKKVSTSGNISFADLEPGLYLLVQRKAAPDYQKVKPFLVTLPMRHGDAYSYQVDASPKVSPIHPWTDNPDQPATGQSEWPFWVFLGSCAALGVLLRFKKRV